MRKSKIFQILGNFVIKTKNGNQDSISMQPGWCQYWQKSCLYSGDVHNTETGRTGQGLVWQCGQGEQLLQNAAAVQDAAADNGAPGEAAADFLAAVQHDGNVLCVAADRQKCVQSGQPEAVAEGVEQCCGFLQGDSTFLRFAAYPGIATLLQLQPLSGLGAADADAGDPVRFQ